MKNLTDPRHRARPVLPPARAHLGAGRAGRRDPGASCSRNMADTFAAISRDPRRAAGDDREVAAHARHGDQLVPRAAAVPGRLRRPLAPAAPGGQRAAALAAGDQPRLRGRHAGPAAHRRPQRRTSTRRSSSSRTCSRTPTPLLAIQRPAHHARGHAARRSSSSRPTRRSATTPTTSSTRSASTSRASTATAARSQNQGVKHRQQRCSRTPSATSRRRGPGTCPRASNPIGAAGRRAWRSAAPTRTPYQPAIDAQGNADCQNGQNGYVAARSRPARATGPATLLGRRRPPAATRPVLINNFPILSGGTYKSRELGIDNLKDVDKLR